MNREQLAHWHAANRGQSIVMAELFEEIAELHAKVAKLEAFVATLVEALRDDKPQA